MSDYIIPSHTHLPIKDHRFFLPISDSTSSPVNVTTPTFSPLKIYILSPVSISAYSPQCPELDAHTSHTNQRSTFRAPSARGQSTLPSPFNIDTYFPNTPPTTSVLRMSPPHTGALTYLAPSRHLAQTTTYFANSAEHRDDIWIKAPCAGPAIRSLQLLHPDR